MQYQVINTITDTLIYTTQPDEHPDHETATRRARDTLRNYIRQYPGVDPDKIKLVPVDQENS